MMDHNDEYKTITETESGEYREKGSKFIGYSFSVNNKADVESVLNRIKKEHPKANHHCYAYRLGIHHATEYSTDDREPAGSAGKPILGVLKSQEINEILMVVVRYFGGTQLGIPGLINAYKQATIETLKKSRIVLKTHLFQIIIACDYNILNEIYRIARKLNGSVKIIESNTNTMKVTINVPFSKRMELLEAIKTDYPVNESCRIIDSD
jgi:uncharacterized YigZ family protein